MITLKSSLLRRLGLAVLLCFCAVVSVLCGSRADMRGELGPDVAYVMSSNGEIVNGSLEVTASIKILKSGGYYVFAGFIKGECWHRGSFSGKRYYGSKYICGEKGDVVNVKIEVFFLPPMNNEWSVGIFKNESDICTAG